MSGGRRLRGLMRGRPQRYVDLSSSGAENFVALGTKLLQSTSAVQREPSVAYGRLGGSAE